MDYSSPIRQIKGSKFNYVSDTAQIYQEQFWKNKAQKMVATIDHLNGQNERLNRRLIEKQRIEQQLRQIIIVYEDDWKKRSRRLVTQRISDKFQQGFEDKITSSGELQRLYKQIRVIKNTHEIQLVRLQQQNKRLRKQVEQLNNSQQKIKESAQNMRSMGKLNEQIKNLKRKLVSNQQMITRLREQKMRYMSDTQQLRRQIQQMTIREKIAQKEEEQKLLDYQRRADEFADMRISKKQSQFEPIEEAEEEQSQKQEAILNDILPQIGKISEEILTSEKVKEELERKVKESKDEIDRLKRRIVELEKRQVNYQDKLKMEQGNLENEKFSHEVKVKKLQGELMEVNTQLSDVLRKLSPLLTKRKDIAHSPQNTQKRASLTILQIFLKKYKIQAF